MFFDKLKYVAVAAVLSAAPLAASAATLLEDGNTYTIGYAEQEFYGDVNSGAGGAGFWEVLFNADTDPVGSSASATIGRIVAGQFSNLVMSWYDAGHNLLSSTSIVVGETTLATVFTAPNMSQYLNFAWTGSSVRAGFDVEVVAAVPVPAAGFLLVGALGGLAALRRRKSTAA